MMKKIIILLLLVTFSCTTGAKKSDNKSITDHAKHQQDMPAGSNKSAKSPHTAAMTNVGENHVHIDYSSPRVRGRQIFGGLVAYNEVWSIGAHKATSISFTQDVEIDQTLIKGGKYGLFTIPGKDSWIVILNTNWNQHLADEYNDDEDVLRIEVFPDLLEESCEELTFKIISKDENIGTIHFQWDKVSFEFDIKNK